MLDKFNSIYNLIERWIPFFTRIAVAIWGFNHSFESFLTFAEQVKKNYAKFLSIFKSPAKLHNPDNASDVFNSNASSSIEKRDSETSNNESESEATGEN